jgi:predicted nucleic-acid-binding protein
MRAIDTNVLVRLITRDDASQVETAQIFVERGVWVSHVVLAETAWVLGAAYELRPAEIAGVIEMLLNHQQLTLQDAEVVEAALDRYRQMPNLGFSDCLVLETARRAGHLPLGTFDRRLSKVEGTELLKK